ncbi:hypothetical protein H310_05591 [Aphanomyces invadans]|uniref:Uncharacterized protein n=1 Tax=Aphanomyces invadans TaxID=157072 RepID=A0A024UA73_9STRA|nr:hypothetical protein H310_05591 [Aphanomyces invadans]ETW03174.1 hypothetical protein H310_05591 [Aphanomyces invadans]|eukprot:XP_008868558.1 hypothetical protein H310_05591 [Aphanomyces invadans]
MAALDYDMDESTIAIARASPAGFAQLKRNALLLLNVHEDGSYKTTIKNVDRFKLAIKLVSHGLSFRQTANAMEAVRATFNLNKLTGIKDNRSMSIEFDGSSHRGTTFIDLRVRLGVKGVVMLKKLLSAIYPSWADKLLAVSTDGEPTNKGRINGVQTQLVGLATHDVLQIWCVPHQMDLVV